MSESSIRGTLCLFLVCVGFLFDYYSFEFLHQNFWTQGGNFASLVAYFFNVRKV